MRKQFDIKYRPQIESGEYKVETNFGSPVEIVCWDRRDDTANKTIVGIIRAGTVEEIASWNIGGRLCDAAFPQNPAYDLFLVTPDEEMTDFEAGLFSAFSDGWQQYLNGEEVDMEQWAKEHSAELLSIARKQLQPEIDAMLEDAYKTADEVQYRKGREEALKDIPRWKKCNPNTIYSTKCNLIVNGIGRYIILDGYMIDVDRLKKLPGFKDDE